MPMTLDNLWEPLVAAVIVVGIILIIFNPNWWERVS